MFLVVSCFFLFVTVEAASSRLPSKQLHTLHHDMTKREVEKIFGVDSHEEVPQYDIVSPYKSDESGNSVDYNLYDHIRTRRGANQQNPVYFKVQAFSATLFLNVTKSNPLISSGAFVQTLHNNGTSTYANIPRGLYYTGHVLSDPGSLVAISGSKGLTGMIRHLEDTFFIHPLPTRLARDHGSGEGHRHVIYRRSFEGLHSDCHISESVGLVGKTPKSANRHRRQKRKAPHKFLEMALVADNFAITDFGEQDMAYHLLTLAHLVTALYHDSSIGPIKITPVVVRIVLKKNGFGYDSASSKGKRIRALEGWARTNLPREDEDPGHADVVVLITKQSSGGIASQGSTCVSSFGAAVINDIGLGSAIVVAHEVAHTMTLGHDGNSPSCPNHVNIMASTIPSGRGAMKWSVCSREKMQDFLRYESTCLDDVPSVSSTIYEPKDFYGNFMGQVTSRDEQCEIVYGQNYYACPQFKKSCGDLACTDNGYRCLFVGTPPADGTRCGERDWCIKGSCVDDGSRVIHGRWSNWSAFSACSRRCGGGIQSKTRTCTNPEPRNGGKDCIGPAQGQWRLCNTQPCPVGSKTFRQIQCEEIDPSYNAHHTKAQCSLSCRKGNVVRPQGRPVKDGTRCTADPTNRNVCVQGQCRLVGCDNVLESTVKRDRCGICGGDSSRCSRVKATWNEQCPGFGADNACVILEVPVGATFIQVQQMAADRNLLGVWDRDGEYVIPIPRWSKTVYVAGTKLYYYHEKDNDKNAVYIPGPTTERLTIVFVPGYPRHAGVLYAYYDPGLKSVVGVNDVEWNIGDWGACTQRCANGQQTRIVECVRKDDKTYIGDKLCSRKSRKPATRNSCNTQPCQPMWYTSDWSPCSRTCGKGTQNRKIYCRRKVTQTRYQTLSDSSCSGNKPTGETRTICNEVNCHGEWFASAWSQCSSTCRGGVMKRSLTCKRRNDEGRVVLTPEILCHHAIKPSPTTKQCNWDTLCPTSASRLMYRGLGCFKDGDPNAVTRLVINFRLEIDWSDINKIVKKCATYVHKNYPKNKVFSVQFFGECWTGEAAERTYGMYGKSDNCWEKVGKEHTNYVYEFY